MNDLRPEYQFFWWYHNGDLVQSNFSVGPETIGSGPPYDGTLWPMFLYGGYDSGHFLALVVDSSGCGSSGGPTGGLCIEKYTCTDAAPPVCTWASWYSTAASATQITQDTVANGGVVYALDGSGVPWFFDSSNSTWYDFPYVGCSDLDNFYATQLVVEDSNLYAIRNNGDDTAGDVYTADGDNDCWATVATYPSGDTSSWAVSLTAPVVSTYSASNGILWATDTSGAIWYLE